MKQHFKKLISVVRDKEVSSCDQVLATASSPREQPCIGYTKMYALEPRIMFDAAALTTAVETVKEAEPTPTATEPVPDVQQLVDGIDQASAITSVLFVDSAVTDYQNLIQDVQTDTQVVILDAKQDGVQKIADTLSQYSNLTSIQILSHGRQAQLSLGNSLLNHNTLDSYQQALKAWGNALSETGDILFYGCNVAQGEAGSQFIQQLSAITGADIAASNDNTGSSAFNGDWTLEVSSGEINSEFTVSESAQTSYGDILAANNNAPVLDNTGTMILTAINEDNTNSAGNSIQEIIDSSTANGNNAISDVDAGAVEGIAITGLTDTNGRWEYKVGAGAWATISTASVADNSALLLSSTDRIRFVPVTGYHGSDTGNITFRAWDTTSGVAGDTNADASVNGGSTAFSTAVETASIIVNDAPVLDNTGTMILAAIVQDNTNSTGNSVQEIIDSSTANSNNAITDVNAGAVEGIAITGLTDTNGSWEYKVGAGAWTAISTAAVADNSALLLSSTDRIRFVPTAGYNGSDTGNITFRAWDTTSGVAGDTNADASVNGGSTAFSTAIETVSITVNDAVNDDPTNAGSLPASITVDQFLISELDLSLIDLSDTDAGSNSISLILSLDPSKHASLVLSAIAAGDSATGVTVSGNNSKTLTLTGTLADLNNYLDIPSNIKYDNNGFTGNIDTLTVKVNDLGNSGSGGGADVTLGNVIIIAQAANVAPSITGLNGDIVTFDILNPVPVILDLGSNLTLSDTDSADFDGGNINVGINPSVAPSEDVLQIGAVNNITTSGSNVLHAGTTIGTFTGGADGNNLVITLNAEATVARVQDLLRALQYTNTNNTPTIDVSSRALILTVNDGDGGSSTSANQNITVSFTGLPVVDLDGNDSSLATNGGYNGSFTISGGAINIADSDSTFTAGNAINEMVFTLTNRPDGIQESLSSTLGIGNQTVGGQVINIGTYDNTTGKLIITGTDITTTNMNTVLQSIQYNNTNAVPDVTDRSITVQVTDNASYTNNPIVTSTIIYDANHPPVVTAPSSLSVVENSNLAITGFSISDSDAGSANVVTTLSVDSGTLTASNLATLVTVSGSGTNTIELTGSVQWTSYFLTNGLVTYTPVGNPPASATLSVFVDDQGNTGPDGAKVSATTNTTINITPANTAPVITNNGGEAAASITVADMQIEVTTMTATDAEGNNISFSITGGADMSLFFIDSATNQLKFKAAPDFNNPADSGNNNIYEVQVTATDDGTGNLTDVQDITITVTNGVVNNSPWITSDGGAATAAVSIQENTTSVTTVTASDPEDDTLTYGITGGADQGKFTIDTNTGALSFISAPDFEVPGDVGGNNIYDVQVTVTDSGAGNLTDVQDIAVTVTDVDESINHAPVITSDGGGATAAVSVQENITAVTTVTSIDVNLDTVSYSITGGSDQALFSIDGTTGALSFKTAPDFENPADADNNNIYDVEVTATDNNGLGNLTDVQTLAISVTNVNEAPVITSDGGGANAAVNVQENSTTVTTLTTSDEDGDTIVYSISGGVDQALFNIDQVTGALSFINSPDFENPTDSGGNNVYDVTVTATETSGRGGNLSDSQDIAVTVTNVNDAPTVSVPANLIVIEDQASALTGISFTDVDAGTGSVVASFSVDSGTLVSAGTGLVTVTGSGTNSLTLTGTVVNINDFINANSVTYTTALNSTTTATLSVSINDQGNSGAGGALDSGVSVVALNVTAVNDAPVGADNTLTIQEEGVRTLVAADFALTDPNDTPANNLFNILVTSLPATSEGVYSLNGVALSVNQVISIVDINNNLLKFTAASNVNGNGLGALGFKVVDDGGTANSGIDTAAVANTLQFNITAVNDAPTVTAPANHVVIEDQASVLTGISFTDVDAGAGNVVASFSVNSGTLAATGTGLVAVTGSGTNSLTLTGTVVNINDFINANSVTYTTALNSTTTATLSVSINDQGNSGAGGALDSGISTVALIVTAVNDAPVITSNGGGETAAISMLEDQTVVTTVVASDVENNTVTYSITGGADQTKFTIDSTTGVLSFITAPDFENPTDVGGNNVYDVQVTASDNGVGTPVDIQNIAVTITDSSLPSEQQPLLNDNQISGGESSGSGKSSSGDKDDKGRLDNFIVVINYGETWGTEDTEGYSYSGSSTDSQSNTIFITDSSNFLSVDSSQNTFIQLTHEAFGFDYNTRLTFKATSMNSEPLPSWIRFDSITGIFEIVSPDQISEPIKLVVTATDSEGNTKTIVITLLPAESEQNEDNVEGNSGDINSKLEGNLAETVLVAGKMSLSEQLNLVGSKGLEQGHLKLLESIIEITKEKDVA